MTQQTSKDLSNKMFITNANRLSALKQLSRGLLGISKKTTNKVNIKTAILD